MDVLLKINGCLDKLAERNEPVVGDAAFPQTQHMAGMIVQGAARSDQGSGSTTLASARWPVPETQDLGASGRSSTTTIASIASTLEPDVKGHTSDPSNVESQTLCPSGPDSAHAMPRDEGPSHTASSPITVLSCSRSAPLGAAHVARMRSTSVEPEKNTVRSITPSAFPNLESKPQTPSSTRGLQRPPFRSASAASIETGGAGISLAAMLVSPNRRCRPSAPQSPTSAARSVMRTRDQLSSAQLQFQSKLTGRSSPNLSQVEPAGVSATLQAPVTATMSSISQPECAPQVHQAPKIASLAAPAVLKATSLATPLQSHPREVLPPSSNILSVLTEQKARNVTPVERMISRPNLRHGTGDTLTMPSQSHPAPVVSTRTPVTGSSAALASLRSSVEIRQVPETGKASACPSAPVNHRPTSNVRSVVQQLGGPYSIPLQSAGRS